MRNGNCRCPCAVNFQFILWCEFGGSCLRHRMATPHDFPQLEMVVKKVLKEKQPFERLEMKKEDLLKMFEVGERGRGWANGVEGL